MQVIRVKDAQEGGKVAFELIKKALEKGATTLGLATGSTPETLYAEMVKSDVDFSNVTTFNLDEYIGLAGDNSQSYRYFMNDHLFNHKQFKETNIEDGLASDPEAEAKRYEALIDKQPIDVQILGIGRNGHIGFNEPGTSFDSLTHVADLTESTIEANKRFFASSDEVPRQALTMGIKTILKSKQIILLAYGSSKAEAIQALVDGSANEAVPATALQKHNDVIVIVDNEAASLLQK